MPKGGPGQQKGGDSQCKVCKHPGKQEIEAMLLNGATYTSIISRMRAAHPGVPELNDANLSRHKHNHLLNRPIKVEEVDPETGEARQGYIIGHLAPAPLVPKEALPAPQDRVTIPDALGVIINAGTRNILQNPELVTPQILVQAMELARKLGLRGDDLEEFRDGWDAVTKKKGEMTRKARKRTVKVTEETVEVHEGPPAPEGPVVDAEIVDATPESWSEDDLKLLEGGRPEE